MILIINGSLGVGKTSLANELLMRYEKTVILDGDELGNVNPFDIYDENRIQHLYKTIALLTKFHKQAGYETVIVNYVFESGESLNSLTSLLESIDKNISVYWITCDKAVQELRILKRGRDDIEWELKRFVELHAIQRRASEEGFIGKEIDSSNRSISEMADLIVQEMDVNRPRRLLPVQDEGDEGCQRYLPQCNVFGAS